jgi:hypothetical protein
VIDLEFKKIVCFFQRKSYDKAVEAFLEAERLSQYELPCKHVTKSEVAAKFDVSYRVLCTSRKKDPRGESQITDK